MVRLIYGVASRLPICAEKADSWGFQKYESLKQRISSLQKQIESKKTYTNYGPCMGALEAKLESLLDLDEVYWKQRSHVN